MYSRDEMKSLKTDFWEGFALYCEVQPYLYAHKKWLLYDTKIKGVELKFDVFRYGASVMIEVNHKSEEQRLAMYEKLTWYKESIEKEFEEPLLWNISCLRDSGQQVSRVILSREGLDFHKRTSWGDYYAFMAQNMFRLETNFLAIVEFIRE